MQRRDDSYRSTLKLALFFVLSLVSMGCLDYYCFHNDQLITSSFPIPLFEFFSPIVFSVAAFALLSNDSIARCRFRPLIVLVLCLVACSPWLCLSYQIGSMMDNSEDAIKRIQDAIQELQGGSFVGMFLASVVASTAIRMTVRRIEPSEDGVEERQNIWRIRFALLIGLLGTFSCAYSAPLFFIMFARESGLYGWIASFQTHRKWCLPCVAFIVAAAIAWLTCSVDGLSIVVSSAVCTLLASIVLRAQRIREYAPEFLRTDGAALSTLIFADLCIMCIFLNVQLSYKPLMVAIASYILLDGVASPLSEYLPFLLDRNEAQEDVARSNEDQDAI